MRRRPRGQPRLGWPGPAHDPRGRRARCGERPSRRAPGWPQFAEGRRRRQALALHRPGLGGPARPGARIPAHRSAPRHHPSDDRRDRTDRHRRDARRGRLGHRHRRGASPGHGRRRARRGLRHPRLPGRRPRSDRQGRSAQPGRVEPERARGPPEQRRPDRRRCRQRPAAGQPGWRPPSPWRAGRVEIVGTDHFGTRLPAELPAEAVPTTVAIGPDGWAYVGQLVGFPGKPGTAHIWRVNPNAEDAVCSVEVRPELLRLEVGLHVDLRHRLQPEQRHAVRLRDCRGRLAVFEAGFRRGDFPAGGPAPGQGRQAERARPRPALAAGRRRRRPTAVASTSPMGCSPAAAC